jgi:hypothetical protein
MRPSPAPPPHGSTDPTPGSYVGTPDLTIAPEWRGERCFIIGGGESVTAQRPTIPHLRGRFIAIKQAVALRPDADVMFVSGKRAYEICAPVLPLFTGKYIITRGRGDPRFPGPVSRIGRTKIVDRLCEDPRYVAGLDAGTSAINLAYHFGATEIVLLGLDYCGARWCNGEYPHFQPVPPSEHHRRHLACLPRFAADLKKKGIRVINTSRRSRATMFEKRSLEAFL